MDNNLPDIKASEIVQEDLSSKEKLTQSYLLLKKKIFGTDELTRKYNDKQKECERLKTELDTTTKVANKATYNYNSTLAKVIKLELLNTKYKKNIESLTEQSNEQKIKTAADQQHIQQLICKIEDLKKNEDDKIIQYDLEKSSLQEKVKELEQELKTLKKSYDTKIKKIEKKIPTEHDNKPKVKEIGINTELTRDEIRQKPKTVEKCVVTNETYNVKEDVYPVFCGKCEVLLEPPPHEKICKMMTNSCPKLIEKISSPKKVSTPLGRSREINSNNYKPENLPTLPNTSHLHNQNNHSNFIPQNLLTPSTPVSSNPPNYCNNFMPPLPNLMSPGTYIGSTPVISVPLTNLNAINQNNQSESIAAVASSLSIISSLHKKIDTLETKLEMLSKVKSKRSNSCCQHQHPTTCTYDMNSSMQFNFMEMWKRMADLYENKDKKKERFDTHKRNSKKLNSHKMNRLTPKKRLQNTHTNSWKVESAAKKVKHSPSRKRLKKRKGRYSLFSKVDISSNNSEDLENSNSDSDTNSYTDVFGNTTISKTNSNIESKNSPCTETSKSIIISNNDLKATTSSTHSTDLDEAETIETIRDSVEFSKSIGGETDSGILSDSVESSKLMPLEANTNTFLDSAEYENTTKIKSSIENRSHPNKNIKPVVKSKLSNRPSIKTVLHLTKFNELTETNTGLKPPSQPNKCNENIEDKEITEAAHDVITQDNACTSTATSSVRKRKRKINEFQEQKNCNKRAKLLKKLRSLRKNSKCINNTSQNISIHQDALNHKDEDSRSSKEQTNLDHDTSITKTEDYVPKKRPRIAHVPKSTTDHTTSPNSSLQVKKCLVKNIEERKIELQTISANNEVSNTTADHTKMQKYDITLNELSETNNELQETNDDGTKQLKSTSVNIINSSIEDSVESNKDETITPDIKNVSSESEIKNSPNVGIHNYNHSNITDESYVNDLEGVYKCDHSNTIIESDVKDSVNETMETEVESNNQCEVFQSLEQKIENSVQESECINEQTSILFQQDLNGCQNFKEKSCDEFDLHSTLNKSGDSMKILDVPTPKSDADTCNEGVTEECSINVQDSIMKEKNTQRVKKNISTKKIKSNKQCKFIEVESMDPLQKLRQYINKNKSQRTYNQNKELSAVRMLTDKFVKRQLQRLIDNDWGISVHCDVIDKLKSVGSSRIIAKEIVEFLSTISEGQPLDKTHTPPAPLMTKNQQKIVTLLVDLEEWDPMIFQLVLAGIEYKLFRLNSDTVVTKTAIESFARMYTILARIKKDREKVRIFCCDALYCLGLNAILVLYTVFTCWPEVFPNNETSNQLLPKCMAHFIMRQQGTDYPKLNALKNLVSVFYKYPSETLSKDLLNELLTTLQEKSHVEVETAIILLGKREGTTWAYKNIIRSALLPMIINNKLPSEYRGLCLLGNLMRVFPLEDKDNSVSETVEQLCDLIKAGSEESSELNEGVISALLSLSRHKFDKVVENTLTWKPAKPLCDRTEKQFNGLFNQRSLVFWNKYLRKNKL
ncbi:uncharacterized protein LOC117605644 [Osmia lignaria lignaria]|uniref:uncharacterized protein LOC117605644 n=1 Tax=Osmia lignaria lignaria TaxID=1437193 RepID=UPI00402BF19F